MVVGRFLMEGLVARVNYPQQKRLKDLERQRKQEEKRNRRLNRENRPEGEEESASDSGEPPVIPEA